MEYIGLLVEIIFLALGIYVYLFSRGLIQFNDPGDKAKAFMTENRTLLRILSLALIAIMGLNVVLHLISLFS